RRLLAPLGRFSVEKLAAVRALGAWMQVVDAPDAESDCRSCDILCKAMAVFRGAVAPKAARPFASRPAGLRLPRTRLCAAQPSPFVFPRCVRVLPSVARPGLNANSA